MVFGEEEFECFLILLRFRKAFLVVHIEDELIVRETWGGNYFSPGELMKMKPRLPYCRDGKEASESRDMLEMKFVKFGIRKTDFL